MISRDASETLTLLVMQVIDPDSCPTLVTTRMRAGTGIYTINRQHNLIYREICDRLLVFTAAPGARSTPLTLVPTLSAADNSEFLTLSAVVNGKTIDSADFKGYGAGAHRVDIVATDDSGNTATCSSTLNLW